MNTNSKFTEFDVARYLEGDMDDPREVAAMEAEIENNPEVWAALVIRAHDLSLASLKPSPSSLSDVSASPAVEPTLLNAYWTLLKQLETGGGVEESAVLTSENWAQLGGWVAVEKLAASSDAQGKLREFAPIECANGIVTIETSLDEIPYGLVRVLLTDRSTKRCVGQFLAAVPRHDDSDRRYDYYTIADFVGDEVDPSDLDARALPARKGTLELFRREEVEAWYAERSSSLDDELKSKIEQLCDALSD